MSFTINTNIASLQAQNYLRTNSDFQSKTINRVTSGLRIVTSGDDAAGVRSIGPVTLLAAAGAMRAGVATIGGPDFGVFGEGYIRLSYANSTENILRALERIEKFLNERAQK